jgi:hypothetical protein
MSVMSIISETKMNLKSKEKHQTNVGLVIIVNYFNDYEQIINNNILIDNEIFKVKDIVTKSHE